MTDRLQSLIAELLSLSQKERQHIAQLLVQANMVRDGDPPAYGVESDGMKQVTVVLPDDLANEARAAGLLRDKNIEAIIRDALKAQPSRTNSSRKPRKLVRKDGRLVVEALPGEHPIADAEVRDHLDKMDW
jgi:hypothetical protein